MGENVAHHTIELDVVSGKHVREILGVWKTGTCDPKACAGVAEDNPLRATIRANQAPDPLRSILASVRNRWGAVMLLEQPYMDLEFWDSHAGLYERCFRDYPSSCQRLHFFSTAQTRGSPDSYDEDLAATLCQRIRVGSTWKEIKATVGNRLCYHGYCILRPISSFVVSRTAILFDPRDGRSIPPCVPLLTEERQGIPFLTVYQTCTSNLFNAHLEIQTTEFIQQDPNLGACATASLWVATRTIGGPITDAICFPYSTITTQALGGWRTEVEVGASYDPDQEGGLTCRQLRNAIEQTGWTSIVDSPKEPNPPSVEADRLRHAIFSYVDSGLPVLLCLNDPERDEGHVVAVVGYSMPSAPTLDSLSPAADWLSKSSDTERRISERHFLVSNAVSLYYTHDDAYGPFNRVRFDRTQRIAPSRRRVRRSHDWAPPTLVVGRLRERTTELAQIVVPVPRDVRQPSAAGLGNAIERFEQFEGELVRRIDTPIFLWRSVLLLGADFKQSITARTNREEIRSWYASLHLPRYVWVYEVSMIPSQEFEQAFWNDGNRLIEGEFVFDATAPYYDPRLLAYRFLGVRWDYRHGDDWTARTIVAEQIPSYRPRLPDYEEDLLGGE